LRVSALQTVPAWRLASLPRSEAGESEKWYENKQRDQITRILCQATDNGGDDGGDDALFACWRRRLATRLLKIALSRRRWFHSLIGIYRLISLLPTYHQA